MKRFTAAVTIRARPETVWALLTDAGSYPLWNSTVSKIDGRIAAGEKISVHAKAATDRAFPVRVTEFSPPQSMVWTGGMPFGLFTGIRHYRLTPAADGTVAFAMQESFSGLLAPLIARAIPDLQPAFDAFAADLKRQAEKI